MNLHELTELAIGPDEARHVDTAVPQHVWERMSDKSRSLTAGWYYAPECRTFGRILSIEELGAEIVRKMKNGQIKATMMDQDVTWAVVHWSCLLDHVLRGEIQLEALP